LDLETFNTDARSANTWTQTQLTSAARDYLSRLPTHEERDGFYVAHASPREPVWEYILDTNLAYVNFTYFDASVCLVGHTHIPAVFVLDEDDHSCSAQAPPEAPLELGEHRMIINPGSVGQPRDGDPRAAYAVLDLDDMLLEFRRADYAVEITLERMRARGLPRRLVDRLVVGR
jgi:diadenosine tetraphosphatase ApaH/serine/threonine PP2A family protein phosphatase